MHQQSDLFDPVLHDALPAPAPVCDIEQEHSIAPLAAPCGFLNCRNQPCRRSASRPLLLDGVQLVHRGVPLLVCDPMYWRDVDPEAVSAQADTHDEPDDIPVGQDDPGSDAPPDYDAWAGWERADDDGFGAGEVDAKEAEEEGRGAFRLVGGTGL